MQKSKWTIRTLLYYDKVYSIVPIEFFEKPDDLFDPFMLELVRQELVTPLNPFSVIHDVQNRINPLIHELELDKNEIIARRERFQEFQSVHSLKFRESNRKIHYEKMGEEIFYNLQCLGLATKCKGYWYKVEPKTATQLMTHLAYELSKEMNLNPATDRTENILFFDFENQENNSNALSVEVTINNLVPRPEDIPMDTLSVIKSNHRDLFLEFRQLVDDLTMLKQFDENEYFSKIQELESKKIELTEIFRKYNIKKIFKGSVISIILSLVSELIFQIPTGKSVAASAISCVIKPTYYFIKSQVLQDNLHKGIRFLALLDR